MNKTRLGYHVHGGWLGELDYGLESLALKASTDGLFTMSGLRSFHSGIQGQRPISGRTNFRRICSLGVNFMQL